MSHHYSPGSGFPGEPHPSHHQQHPGQPWTPMPAGGRTPPHASPRAALTCWMVVLPAMVRYKWTVSEGMVFTTRDSRTTSRT